MQHPQACVDGPKGIYRGGCEQPLSKGVPRGHGRVTSWPPHCCCCRHCCLSTRASPFALHWYDAKTVMSQICTCGGRVAAYRTLSAAGRRRGSVRRGGCGGRGASARTAAQSAGEAREQAFPSTTHEASLPPRHQHSTPAMSAATSGWMPTYTASAAPSSPLNRTTLRGTRGGS